MYGLAHNNGWEQAPAMEPAEADVTIVTMRLRYQTMETPDDLQSCSDIPHAASANGASSRLIGLGVRGRSR